MLRVELERVLAQVRQATAKGLPVERLRQFARYTRQVEALRREFMALLVGIVTDGILAGVFRPTNTAQAATAFQGMVANTAYAALASGESLDAERQADFLVDLFVNGAGRRTTA